MQLTHVLTLSTDTILWLSLKLSRANTSGLAVNTGVWQVYIQVQGIHTIHVCHLFSSFFFLCPQVIVCTSDYKFASQPWSMRNHVFEYCHWCLVLIWSSYRGTDVLLDDVWKTKEPWNSEGDNEQLWQTNVTWKVNEYGWKIVVEFVKSKQERS